jgi:hypothetical protein
LAVLAVGFLIPQAFGHVTNNVSHMLEHIFNIVTATDQDVDAIKTKTDNLPEDP